MDHKCIKGKKATVKDQTIINYSIIEQLPLDNQGEKDL